MMVPLIQKTHVLAKNIFGATEIKNSRFTYLNLKTFKKKTFTNDGSYGIYLMFFKNYLIYIGMYCGKNSVLDRWEKHLKTDTSRFRPINFLKCTKKERDNLNNLTLDKLEKYYEDKKNKLIRKYKKSDLNQSSIYNDVIQEIVNVNFIKEKENFKTLCYDGSDQSLNRLKLADYFWSDLKSRDENNIFNDFEFVYLKFSNLKKFQPKGSQQKDIKKEFEKNFEIPLIKKYKPAANDNKDKETSKFILKKYNISKLIKDTEIQMTKLFKRQDFFLPL